MLLMMQIMSWFWILLLFCARISRCAIGNYHCTMQSFDVICTGINADQLPKDISVTLNKTDIVSFNITKGFIPTISPTSFKNFINLQSLYITNSKVSNLEDNAFSHALDLQDLSLNNNVLSSFNSRSLSPENRLRTLDLSNNLLNDFADFNISYFPKLNALNLASNLLTHLPVNLVQMLKEQNEFYLVADNNPWNCSHPNWSEYLTDQLVNAFCTNKTFAQEIDGRMIIRSEQTEENDCKKPDCTKCSFYYCLLWSFCGIWIGIIVGNIGKIKNLICGRPVAYVDEYTQCEYSLGEQYMMSGLFDPKSNKLKPTNTLGFPVPNKEKM